MRLRKLLFRFYFVLAFFNLVSIARGQILSNGYLITGRITGLPDNVKLYLIRLSTGDTIQTTLSKDEKFKLEGNYKEIGEMHFLKLDSSNLNFAKGRKTWIRLYFEGVPIFVKSSLSEWPVAEVSGAQNVIIYNEMQKQLAAYSDEYVKLSSLELDSLEGVNANRNLISKQLRLYLKYSNSWAAADLGRVTSGFGFSELSSLYNSLSSEVKESFPGRVLKEKMLYRSPEKAVRVDNLIPDFVTIDSTGQILNVSDLVKKSKYTLIDFWASWCKPCIARFPELQVVRNLFERSDFQIIGLSLDRNKEDWLKAIMKTGTKWQQVIDVRGDKVKSIFGMSSIPSYLLLDDRGRMIAYYCAAGEVSSFGPNISNNDSLVNLLKKIIN